MLKKYYTMNFIFFGGNNMIAGYISYILPTQIVLSQLCEYDFVIYTPPKESLRYCLHI
jgi:hypothetical protein